MPAPAAGAAETVARCKRRPNIRAVAVPASPATVSLEFPSDTVAFILRPRTAVGVQIRVASSGEAYFSLGAAETYSEEDLKLDEPLELLLSAASAVTVEVWQWGA